MFDRIKSLLNSVWPSPPCLDLGSQSFSTSTALPDYDDIRFFSLNGERIHIPESVSEWDNSVIIVLKGEQLQYSLPSENKQRKYIPVSSSREIEFGEGLLLAVDTLDGKIITCCCFKHTSGEPIEIFLAKEGSLSEDAYMLLTQSFNNYKNQVGGKEVAVLRVSAGSKEGVLYVAIGVSDHKNILSECLGIEVGDLDDDMEDGDIDSPIDSLECKVALEWKGGAFFKTNWDTGKVVIFGDSVGLKGPIPLIYLARVKASLELFINEHFLKKT